jgi:hypothetical protein
MASLFGDSEFFAFIAQKNVCGEKSACSFKGILGMKL